MEVENMSCIWRNFAYSYRHGKSMRGYRYNWLTRRYKRRNHKRRYSCKKHKDFCALMDSLYGRCHLYILEQIKAKLQPFILWLKRYYELILLHEDLDYRSGFATYGYISDLTDKSNEEYIVRQLDYISDRWQCSFRVRWIINLLDPEYEPSTRTNTGKQI